MKPCRVLSLVVVAACFSVLGPMRGYAQSCEPTPDRHAFALNGEVSGERSYFDSVGSRWSFKLERNRYGWSIGLIDSTNVDLTTVTPPLKFGENHRDIAGWHFRNAQNTGSNDGTVNAPQLDRIFLFATSSDAVAAFHESQSGASGLAELNGIDGRGSLRILDMGLTDLEPGQKARLTYMRFRACLTWPKLESEIVEESNYNSLDYIDEEKEILRTCGLSAEYELDAWIKPRYLGGDFDGDDAGDDVGQVRRRSDGQRGIFICRAGTWSYVLGMKGEMASTLPENGFGAIEAWFIQKKDAPLGDGSPQPGAAGDVLVLERTEKSQHVVYWQNGAFATRTVYRLVEPDR